MGIERKYPYSNLHDVNMDWILEVVKTFQEQYSEIDQKIADAVVELNEQGQSILDSFTATLQELTAEEQAEVIAAINARAQEVMSQIPAEYTELMAMLAKTFSTSTNYKIGDMVIYYNGTSSDLYVFKEDHSAGAWNANHVTKTELGSQCALLYQTFYGFRKNLTNEDDLDTLLNPGWYIIGNSIHPINTPEPSNVDDGLKYLTVKIRGDVPLASNTQRMQEYINLNTGKKCHRLFVSGAWEKWTSDFSVMVLKDPDLNNLISTGVYTVPATMSLTNEPVTDTATNHQRMIIMYTAVKEDQNRFRWQFYANKNLGAFYVRVYTGGQWANWVSMNNFGSGGTLADGADLNGLYNNGWYIIGYSNSALNSPEPSGVVGQRIIHIYSGNNAPTATTYRFMRYYNFVTNVKAIRLYVGQTWIPWIIDSSVDENTYNAEFTATAQASQGDNAGDTFSIITYNVARYRFSDEEHISDPRLFNLRKFLSRANADVVCTQEDFQYIDADSTKSALSYIWLPQYPRDYGRTNSYNCIHTKYAATSNGRVKYTYNYSAYRNISWALYPVGDNNVLICTSHPNWNDAGGGGTSADNIEIRRQQYAELFNWVTGSITLNDMSTNNPVSAPAHTHCIICMDANTATDDDKTNLTNIANSHNFVMGNGGRLGWIASCRLRATEPPVASRIDNIIVSSNVIIEDFEVFSEWYGKLWSDHVPCMAKVRLLNN